MTDSRVEDKLEGKKFSNNSGGSRKGLDDKG